MKITNRMLRQIIKEEKLKILNEQRNLDQAAQIIYSALLDIQEDLAHRGIDLQRGEFAMALERAMQRFKY